MASLISLMSCILGVLLNSIAGADSRDRSVTDLIQESRAVARKPRDAANILMRQNDSNIALCSRPTCIARYKLSIATKRHLAKGFYWLPTKIKQVITADSEVIEAGAVLRWGRGHVPPDSLVAPPPNSPSCS